MKLNSRHAGTVEPNKDVDPFIRRSLLLAVMTTQVMGLEECFIFWSNYCPIGRVRVSVLTYKLHGKYLIKDNHLCIPERSLPEQIIEASQQWLWGGFVGDLGKDKTLAIVTDHCSLVKYLQRYR